MNVQTREQFDNFLADLQACEVKVFDTETNTLKVNQAKDALISLALYFPAVDRSYSLPFRYGEGTIVPHYTDANTPETPFEKMNWQGRTKKELYLAYWFEQFKQSVGLEYFNNLPIEWLDEIKQVWGHGTYIAHNSRFDAHVLRREGFPDMVKVYDTMIGLHLVNEDWQGIKLTAPYTYTKKDKDEGKCTTDKIGLWAVDENGVLLEREQFGNRRLKWQAALHGFEDATLGERGLADARSIFEETLTDFIMEDWYNSMNNSLFTKSMLKLKNSLDDPHTFSKARAKVRAKIEIDSKANMWMLPSNIVVHYAELDVKLTWQLYNWCLQIIKEWNNEDLWEVQSRIHHDVAWRMEVNGFKLDVEQAEAEIRKLEPRMQDIATIIDTLAKDYGLAAGCDVKSPAQLLPLLNSGILGDDLAPGYVFPAWWEEANTLGLKTYPGIKINEGDLDEATDWVEGTNKAELDKVADHPVARLIREHRRMSKTVTTYLKKWLNARDENNIVHGSINDDGTVTGRCSSSGDAGNFQNIPDRNGYTVKKAIVPYNPDWVLWSADYSQLELRLAAWIAEGLLGFDPNMTLTNLLLSTDVHAYTSDMMDIRGALFGDMTDEQIIVRLGYSLKSDTVNTAEKMAKIIFKYCRFVAKTCNFGLLYSGRAPMLSRALKIDRPTAQVLVNKWLRLFPAFPLAQEYFTEEALRWRDNPAGTAKALYVQQPISGRYRKLHKYSTYAKFFRDGRWQTFNPQESAARSTWNAQVQGLGGYLAMASALNITDTHKDKIRMFASIHDALDGYVRVEDMSIIASVPQIMCDWPEIVPGLEVELSGSRDGTWHDMAAILQFSRWVATKGKEGYDVMKDHLGRQVYKWQVRVIHNEQSHIETAFGISPQDAQSDTESYTKFNYKGEDVSVVVLNPESWEKA